MAEYNQKRDERRNKRAVKKAGNKSRRQFLKRSLEKSPEDAEDDVYHFGPSNSSKVWNKSPYEEDIEDYKMFADYYG